MAPPYIAPLAEMEFALRHLAGLADVCALPLHRDVEESVCAVLAGAARFAGEVLAPLNATGDRHGSCLEDGEVRTTPGFAAAYGAFCHGGWNGLSAPPGYGGQGLPRVLAIAVEEMWNSANLAFALAPMLTATVVHALARHGSPEQQASYLPSLVSGRWTGTMNLTEPHAGSDLGALRAVAVADGAAYRLRGTKAFITWGDHDLAENVVHLVLARTPGAPEGTRGLSLFIVPKRIPGPDGRPGARNDVTCLALERKAGIRASPTCLLSYGDAGGAFADRVGEPERGLEYMYTLMRHARLAVAIEGVALAERACQAAHAYAEARIQGRDVAGRSAERVPIIRHPDVRRMLLSMKCRTEAMRALTYHAAATDDLAASHPDAQARRRFDARLELLTPIVKGWCTEQAVDIASLGMQVHGGAGYVEDTGVAQFWRDARVTPIYEGTTGIQAKDLVSRKVAGDGGAAAFDFIADMRSGIAEAVSAAEDLREVAGACSSSLDVLESATRAVLAATPAEAAAAAVPYLELIGTAAGGWMMLRAAGKRLGTPSDAARRAHAAFYANHVLTRCGGLAHQVTHGPRDVIGAMSMEASVQPHIGR